MPRGLFFDKTYGNLLKVKCFFSLKILALFLTCADWSVWKHSLLFSWLQITELVSSFKEFCLDVISLVLSGEKLGSSTQTSMYRLVSCDHSDVMVLNQPSSQSLWIPGSTSCTPSITSPRFSSLRHWWTSLIIIQNTAGKVVYRSHTYFRPLPHVRSQHSQGVQCGDVLILYKMIWQDVRGAVDKTHAVSANGVGHSLGGGATMYSDYCSPPTPVQKIKILLQGLYAAKTLENVAKYISRDPRLPKFLDK